jgi:hypothetical protein
VFGGGVSGAIKAGLKNWGSGCGRGAAESFMQMTPKGFAKGTKDLAHFVPLSAKNIASEFRQQGVGKTAKAWGSDIFRGAKSSSSLVQGGVAVVAPMVRPDHIGSPDPWAGISTDLVGGFR